MAARRSGPFDRRCGDRNHGTGLGTMKRGRSEERNRQKEKEHGKQRERERGRSDDGRFEGFFSKEDSAREKHSEKQRQRDGTPKVEPG